MNLLSIARNKGFWLLDKIRGGDVAKSYREIKLFDSLDSSDIQIKLHQNEALRNLLEKSSQDTEYYSRYRGLSFNDYPVINKNIIRGNQDAFISKRYKRDELIKMSTSGSTGTPFICYQNHGKKKTVNAEIIYFSEKVGYKLGENLSYIRTIVKQNKKSLLKQFLQNQTLINCMSLDDDGIRQMLRILESRSKKGNVVLLGYGSTYTAIKDFAKSNDIKKFNNQKVIGVISGSDMLFDETRNSISFLFGDATVVSRYSNEENGVIGQDEGINNVFTINEANYIVEICDDKGLPVEDGVLGHIVVTDLYNYAMPMIRYDTGDIGAIKLFEINGRKKRCICDFSGRSVDVIKDTNGKALSPHAITNYMWSYPEINQYQIIQKQEKKYTVKLNVPKHYSREKELEKMLLSILGEDAILNIEFVDEIPVLSSGKRRYIINEIENN